MTRRKTIDVADLITHTNHCLAQYQLSREAKCALCNNLEYWLLETGNYAGFRYLFDWTNASDSERTERAYDRNYNVHAALTTTVTITKEERDALHAPFDKEPKK